MKWFKHMTDASNDELVVKLRSKFGPTGYMVWFLLLELIGGQMKKGSCDTSVTYPLYVWIKKLDVKKYIFVQIVQFLYEEGKAEIAIDGTYFARTLPELCLNFATTREKHVTISIPKLLKLKDEYSKKSGQCPDNVRAYKEKDKEYTRDINISRQDKPAEQHTIWDIGVKMLVDAGMSDGKARSLLGGCIKKYTEGRVEEAVLSCGFKMPADPKTYLISLLKEKEAKAAKTPEERRMEIINGEFVC